MNERDEHIECCFDAYCKRLLKHEIIDAIREQERDGQRETPFSDLTQEELRQLCYIDNYAPDRCVFSILDTNIYIEITDGDLVQALSSLSIDRRDIILLAYLLDLSDFEIAKIMHLSRSAVQRRRISTLKQLRKRMTEIQQ